jgi:hypothetical protein
VLNRILLSSYYANILISVGAFFMTWQAVVLNHKATANDMLLCGFVGCATFIYYGLHDFYTKVYACTTAHATHRHQFWQHHFKAMLAAIAAVSLLAVWLAWQVFTPYRVAAFSIAGMVTALYTFPLLPFKYLHRWKENACLKLSILSGVWAAITTIITLPNTAAFTTTIGWLFFLRWIFMVVICLPFEVRDEALDKLFMKKTLSEMIGPGGYKALLIYGVVFYVAMLAIGVLQGWLHVPVSIMAIFHIAYTAYLVKKSIQKPQGPMVYLWLDAQIILQPIIIGAGAWFAYIRNT